MLKELINISSVTGGEAEIQKYIMHSISTLNLTPSLFKGNVFVVIRGFSGTKCIIFNSHVDTVAPGSIDLWKTNPFKASEKQGRVYGLGASDNKASVAALLMLAQKLSVKKPDCDVILTFTVGEEVDGHGTNDLVKLLTSKYLREYKKLSAIVCEPTNLCKIGLAHKGNLFIKITTRGRSGHGFKPILSKYHAVLKMNKVINALEELGKKWEQEYKNKILGTPTVGLATSINAGSILTPNKFPDKCVASFDIRTVPEMHNKAFKDIQDAIRGLGKAEYLYPPVLFGYTEEKSLIAQTLKAVTKKEFIAFPGSTDMPFFTQKGIPTVIFGPGEISQMHKPNEYCYAGKVDKCVAIFLKVISGYNKAND